MQSFRELRVWQAGIELVTMSYQLTRRFPDAERFGLISQVQRAAVSIPANIAEGHGRGTSKAFRSFLWISNGSLTELETHLVIAVRLGYVTDIEIEPLTAQIQSIGKMLTALRRSLDQREP